MFRVCNENDKEILKANFTNVSAGNQNAAWVGQTVATILGTILCVVIVVSGVVLLDLDFDKAPDGVATAIVCALIMGGSNAIARYRYEKKQKKRMINNGVYGINGATVSGIDYINNYIYYIEDYADINEKEKYIIRYTAKPNECKTLTKGSRIGILYFRSNGCYINRILILNEQTSLLIDRYSDIDINTIDMSGMLVYPNRNCRFIATNEYRMTSELKNRLIESMEQQKEYKSRKRVIIVCLSYLFLFANGIWIFLAATHVEKTTVILSFTIANAINFLFDFVIISKFVRNKKAFMAQDMVKEVVFSRYKQLDENGYILHPCVYEWEDGLIKEIEYDCKNSSFISGEVLYMINAGKITYFIRR